MINRMSGTQADHSPGNHGEAAPLSEVIADAFSLQEGESTTLGEVLGKAAERGYGLLIVLVSLPVVAPFTPPGLSIPFGLLLLGLAIQLIMKKPAPLIPKWVAGRKIKASHRQAKFVGWMVKTSKFFERFLRPRMTFMFKGWPFYAILVPALVIGGVVMLAPLPVVNSVSSGAALLIGLALLEDDGVFALLGILASLILLILTIAFIWAIATYGMDGIKIVEDFVKGRGR